MRRLAAAFLIPIGSFLEVYYYAERFRQDGTPFWLALVIGVALTLFLSVLTILRSSRLMVVGALALAGYSIICTAAGQAFSLGLVLDERAKAAATEAISSDEVDEIKARISALDSEDEEIRQALAGMSASDMANWYTRGVAPLRARQTEISKERSGLEARLAQVRSTMTTHAGVDTVELNVYDYYSGLTGIGAKTLQLILQFALSAAIAAMAPTGIILLTWKREDPKPEEQEEEGAAFTKDDADIWVRMSFAGVRKRGHDYLVNQDSVKRYASLRGWDVSRYDSVLTAAVAYGIVREDGDVYRPVLSEDETASLLKAIGRH